MPPLGRWWPGSRRWSYKRLLAGLRQAVWTLPEFRQVVAGITCDWGEILDWRAAWVNVTLAAQCV